MTTSPHHLFSAAPTVVRSVAPPRRRKLAFAARRSAVILPALASLAIVGYVDYVTSPELSFTLFYLIPVSIAAWWVGRGLAVVMAIASTATWLLATLYGFHSYFHPSLLAALSAALMLALLIAAAALLCIVRSLTTDLGAMVDDRTRALRRLAAELSAAEDAERRRLAYDIHDGFSQTLSLLKMNLSAAVATHTDAPASPERAAADQRVADAIGMVNDLIQRSRTLTFDLHPTMLDHLGLVPTLQRYGQQFGQQAQVEVTVSEVGTRSPLPPAVANYLFRAVRELLSNAARHGGARQVVLAAHWMTDADGCLLRIVVDDDGRGFDADAVWAAESPRGLGLPGMRERLLSLGGALRIESTPGNGTRAVIEVPCPDESANDDKEMPA